MKVGIMSDSHDHIERIRRAVEVFNDAGVEHVLHGGDYVAPFVIPELARLKCPVIGVFGNNDGERLILKARFSSVGEVLVQPAILELGGKKFVIVHEEPLVEALAASRRFDVVIYGHTHNVDIRSKDSLIINPGETCGWLTGMGTVVVLDMETMQPELVGL